jgi:hypothetical protein
MKKLLIALAAVLITASSYGQGQVVFANKVGTAVDAPVTVAGSNPAVGPGPTYSAQLYLVGAGGSLTALTPASTFRPAGTGGAAIADRYWVNQDVTVPGVASAAEGTFRVRAWLTSAGSFDAAKTAGGGFGESADFKVTVGGGLLPSANLTTLQAFTVVPVPEPTIIALGVLGASALFLRRRK